MGTIHPSIFLRRALWADSIALRVGSIMSREQFKPIRIGENLVVNYNVGLLMGAFALINHHVIEISGS